ncbi:MAG TPA: DUF2505 domain-containing protein [Pseudonocardiaceae bacterium]|jgi:hypothetical protein|nr:DUF2505 domain-containing protein [Pseudonocardiaceae bacterium]
MTSRLELRHRYPEPPQRMRQVLTDATFLQDKLRAVGGPGAELVSREETAHQVTVVLRQTVPADLLPSFIRSVLPGDLTIRRTETWTNSSGTVHSVVDGAPGTITGEMGLEPDNSGSVHSFRLEATVPLPLIGGKVEKSITEGISKLLDVEYSFTLQWLHRAATT